MPPPEPPRSTFDFEGRTISAREGDTVASALFRAGVRTFSRSFKYHRKRGLYCLTGDCPNCLMTVDGEPAVRSCTVPAAEVRTVARGTGWPSADFDLQAILWRLRRFLPVGFYYKSMIRPRWLWPLAERVIRRIAGLGPIRFDLPARARERRSHHPDLLVVGGGCAGLAAGISAAARGESVMIVDEGEIATNRPPGEDRERLVALRAEALASPAIELLERAQAVGLYQGPLVPVVAADRLHLVQAGRVVVATGAVERHAVFPGGDLPGVWLARGAARLAAVHGLLPGREMVVVVAHAEGLEHVATLHAACERLDRAARLTVVGEASLVDRLPGDLSRVVGARVVRALGRGAVRGVVLATAEGERTLPCDALILALGFEPRSGLLRQAAADGAVQGAGDVVFPGCNIAEAEASGVAAASPEATIAVPRSLADPSRAETLPPEPQEGFVCLCEDVEASELDQAWREGFRSTELLKRYTTVTMGACQGALCQAHLRSFVSARAGGAQAKLGAVRPTVARPPARPVRLEDLAAGVRVPLEYHTALHDRHLEMGAVMEWSGLWKRPSNYGDVAGEIRAVREGVSLMDVSTLGKFRVRGRDATAFLERLYPCRIADLPLGRVRYALLLNEAGYIVDDGLVAALGADDFELTFTSAGADAAEAWLREWAEAWGLSVRISNLTHSRGAIHVAGPKTRELLARLTGDPIDGTALPFGSTAEIRVAGVLCRAVRVGFVGELSIELHLPAREAPAVWDALLDAGRDLGVRPHGLDALKVLRLEKGHFIVGLDTDFDSTPAKVGAAWAVRMEKPEFIGREALVRLATLPQERSLVKLAFAGERTPEEGAQLFVDGAHVGHLTSSRYSATLGHGVALGWVRHAAGAPPTALIARDTRGELAGLLVAKPFYDPHGERQRA